MAALLKDDPRFVSDIFWSDGMVRATGREYNGLIDSPCYKNAPDDEHRMSCASCHAMHQTADDRRPVVEWADDQLAPQAIANGACLQCHDKFGGDKLAAHTKHRADSSGSSCYNCHMPYTTYGLLKTIRSHQVSSPSARATLETGRPAACNLCHLDKTLDWTAARLSDWYGQPRPADGAMGDDNRSVAASIVSLLTGDAGQRAIAAQAMGWAPAQQVSGNELDAAVPRAAARRSVRRGALHRLPLAPLAARVRRLQIRFCRAAAAACGSAPACAGDLARYTFAAGTPRRPGIALRARRYVHRSDAETASRVSVTIARCYGGSRAGRGRHRAGRQAGRAGKGRR
jgi:hypothetical protein